MIIPPDKAWEIVSSAGKAYLRECPCRVLAQNCPRDTWEVCLLFENASQEELRGTRPISTAEALSILETAAGRRAIHNLFYTHHGQKVTEICSCCTCCCRPLRRMKAEGNYSTQLRSEYVAVTDPELCIGCGSCEESCFFAARWAEDGTLHLTEEQCFGCGRCIESCTEGAIQLERKIGRGIEIPTAYKKSAYCWHPKQHIITFCL